MDATLIAATHAPPPRGRSGRGLSARARSGLGQENRKACFGYELHVGVDETSGLIRQAHLTAARVQDVEMLAACTVGGEAAVYADRGYEGRARRAALKARGLKDRIMPRRHKHIAVLPRW